MRIAAIYIQENSLPYIFGEGHGELTLNLGGKFFYNAVQQLNGNLTIDSKEINPQYINNFWSENISLVTAFVGANGTGKSTILQQLKEGGFQLICEDKNGGSKVLWPGDIGFFIYYTPYFAESREDSEPRYTYNISKLAQLKRDSSIEAQDINTHLEYHNSEVIKRIITFLKSKTFDETLKSLNIPKFEKVQVQTWKIYKDDWDTSRRFRPFFEQFDVIKEKERVNTETEILNRLGLKTKEDIEQSAEYNRKSRQLRLKLELLDSVIRKIHSILESSGNKYLEEGFIESDISVDDEGFSQITTLKEAFYWFIDNAYIQLNGKFYLPKKEIKGLVELLLKCAEENEEIKNWGILTVDFENCFKIIDVYKKFLLAFRDKFTYDKKPMLTFKPDKILSSGEMALYDLFASLYELAYIIENSLEKSEYYIEDNQESDTYILLLDEADLGFHPKWKRLYVNALVKILPEIFQKKKIQIILSTHSPISLSDFPKNNVLLLERDEFTGNTVVSEKKITRINSFGANINDLLGNSFFLENSLIGDFAKNKIDSVIEWIKKNKNNPNYDREQYHSIKKTISLIEESVLRNKLVEMLSEVQQDREFIQEMMDKELELLRQIRDSENA